jgi:hypothetical protein
LLWELHPLCNSRQTARSSRRDSACNARSSVTSAVRNVNYEDDSGLDQPAGGNSMPQLLDPPKCSTPSPPRQGGPRENPNSGSELSKRQYTFIIETQTSMAGSLATGCKSTDLDHLPSPSSTGSSEDEVFAATSKRRTRFRERCICRTVGACESTALPELERRARRVSKDSEVQRARVVVTMVTMFMRI